jgi:transcription elongation factor S-II
MNHDVLDPEKGSFRTRIRLMKFDDYNITREKTTNERGLLECIRCKGINTTYTQLQTRRGDECITSFALCYDCEKRWKFC